MEPNARLNAAMRIMDQFVSKLPLHTTEPIVDASLARNPVKSSDCVPTNGLLWSEFLVGEELSTNPIGMEGYPPEVQYSYTTSCEWNALLSYFPVYMYTLLSLYERIEIWLYVYIFISQMLFLL